MLKIKQVADLWKKYFLSSHRIKLANWGIIILTICSLLGLITHIRAPAFIKILLLLLGVPLIYKLHLKLRRLRFEIDSYLIIRESLVYVLRTNRLYTTFIDKDGNKQICRSVILQYDLDKSTYHIFIKALITGDEFSKKVQSLDEVLAGVLELELDEKIIHPSFVEYHFYYKQPDRLILHSHNQKQEIDSLDIDLGYDIVYNPMKKLSQLKLKVPAISICTDQVKSLLNIGKVLI
ncbi:cell division protein FtsK [Streptococcus parauberis]|uniref:cell division protein FtsK n=1 Tax=Streptococcus parauberis TaxID=1348 RepID=UPI000C6955FD|nr:hypothetical protein ADO05_01905 [Streptococcus parauberis]POS68383.1 hypothetical protein AOS90_00063 [Streptococcus parauberis]